MEKPSGWPASARPPRRPCAHGSRVDTPRRKAKRQRKKLAQAVRRKVERIEYLEAQDPELPRDQEEIRDRKKELIQLVRPRQPYTTAARVYLRGFRHVPWVDEVLLNT